MPAPPDTGIVFRRVDLDSFEIEAHGRNVARVSYATSLMKKGVLLSIARGMFLQPSPCFSHARQHPAARKDALFPAGSSGRPQGQLHPRPLLPDRSFDPPTRLSLPDPDASAQMDGTENRQTKAPSFRIGRRDRAAILKVALLV